MRRLVCKSGETFLLHDDGCVAERENGMRFDDHERAAQNADRHNVWRILGVRRRAHSARLITLQEIAAGADIGQGWIEDIDHGTRRQWCMPKDRRMRALVPVDAA